MDIYVGNLSSHTTEVDLRRVFEAHGQVASVIVMRDKVSQNPLGFGFVEIPNDEEAGKAIEVLNGTTINERSIIVTETRRKGDQRLHFEGTCREFEFQLMTQNADGPAQTGEGELRHVVRLRLIAKL